MVISPGPLAHVGFRASLSLDRDAPPPHPRALLLVQLFWGWICSSSWQQWKWQACLQPPQDQWPQLCLVLTSSPECQDLGGGEWLVRGRVVHAISCTAHLSLLLPIVSAEWHLYQLLPKGVTLVKCHTLQHEWFFSILHFSPATSLIPLKCLFYFKRTLPWNTSVGKSNYIFSSGLPLKKPPYHLWLKHRDYSRGKTLLVTAWLLPSLGFTNHFSLMLRAVVTVWLIAAALLLSLPPWEGWGPSPSRGQVSHSMSHKQ